MNIVHVNCYRFYMGNAFKEDVKIDLDQYTFFEIEYRAGSWHIVGYRADTNRQHYITEELSLHQVSSIEDVAKFIVQVNIQDTTPFRFCKVSKFNNLHHSPLFYKELSKLLNLVQEYTEGGEAKEGLNG